MRELTGSEKVVIIRMHEVSPCHGVRLLESALMDNGGVWPILFTSFSLPFSIHPLLESDHLLTGFRYEEGLRLTIL